MSTKEFPRKVNPPGRKKTYTIWGFTFITSKLIYRMSTELNHHGRHTVATGGIGTAVVNAARARIKLSMYKYCSWAAFDDVDEGEL